MKIKLESQKTTLRVTKDEFQTLLIDKKLHEKTLFPDGNSIDFHLCLNELSAIRFEGNKLTISLPNHAVRDHKPNKLGLFFMLKDDNFGSHELIFQVDIKKPPITSNKKNNQL